MNKLLDLFRLIPNTGKMIGFGLILFGALAAVYLRWGLVPAIFVLVAFGVIFLAILLYNQAVKVKQRQDGLAFGKALNAAHRGPGKDDIKSAVDDLSRKWQEAMTNLKSHNIDIYHLPWYMLIGEPQSGKSTTLEFSGLQFPIGREAISGGGGTRNCDWWFTEKGVILDTAGRFTFQEGTATDSAEWGHFLQLLARHRPYCPINGVILVIPVDALLDNDPATLDQKARNISEKLLHIQRTLAIQFPVYVMITKCDLIYGFTQFFNKASADRQREMLGWSSDQEDSGFEAKKFNESFERMLKRLDGLRLQHLSQPHFVDDLDKTFVFPEEFRSLQAPLQRYLEIIFQASVYKDPIFFRGYYFSSGMQEGTPIVKACQAMIGNRNLLEKLENLFKKSRAFFVRDFYTAKVFPEEGLVRRAQQYARKDNLKRRLILLMNVGMLLVGALLMWGMYASLSQRLDGPKKAIDKANSQLKGSQATFFGSPADRVLIFQTLSELKQGVGASGRQSFLIFLKSQQNDLTEHLQDTFAYLFLDRVMLGLEEGVNHQLSGFSIARPNQPRNSANELKRLCRALAELKRWQLMVAREQTTDFDPTILPFLEITASPDWDHELAGLRGDRTVVETLEAWFQEVYARSSSKTRSFLIKEMVKRSQDLYGDLAAQVISFYSKQPELGQYAAKNRLIEEILADYGLILDSAASPDEYHERLLKLSAHFTEEQLALINSESDTYLPFDSVRTSIIEALGPAFVALIPARDDQDSGGSSGRDSAEAERERSYLPLTVTFVNRLMAIDGSSLPDPKRDRPPSEGEHLTLPPAIASLWTRILQPYTTEFITQAPYAAMPAADQGLNENLASLFDTGADRISRIKTLFEAEIFKHSASLTDEDQKRRFEKAMLDFHDHLVSREQAEVNRVLALVVSGKVAGAPSPPQSWSNLVSQFNSLSTGGSNFEAFTRGPEDLRKTLAGDYQRQLRTIYFRSPTPDQAIEAYIRNAHSNLSRFGQTLAALNAISGKDLAQNKSKYMGSFPEAAQLQSLKQIADTPEILTAHRGSLGQWADTALESFRTRVRGADPCPECKVAWRDLTTAWHEVPGGFPVRFEGLLQRDQIGSGRVRISVSMTPKDKLDVFLEKLENYRQPGTKHREFLKEMGFEKKMDEALAWADGVKQILNPNQQVMFQVQHQEGGNPDLESLTTELTFGSLSGALTSRKLNLNSPRMLEVKPDPAAESDISILRFFNDSPGNETESVLEINQGLPGLIAFALEGAVANEKRDYFIKPLILPLNTGTKKVDGAFHLKLPAAIAPPPDWSFLGN